MDLGSKEFDPTETTGSAFKSVDRYKNEASRLGSCELQIMIHCQHRLQKQTLVVDYGHRRST